MNATQGDGRVSSHREARPGGRREGQRQPGRHLAPEVGLLSRIVTYRGWTLLLLPRETSILLGNTTSVQFLARCLLLKEAHEQDWDHFRQFTSLLPDLKSSPEWPDVERNVVDQIADRWRLLHFSFQGKRKYEKQYNNFYGLSTDSTHSQFSNA